MRFSTSDSRLFDVYLRINNAVESAVEFNIDCHHGFTAFDVETMNMRGMTEIVFRGLLIKLNYSLICVIHIYIYITLVERKTYLQ